MGQIELLAGQGLKLFKKFSKGDKTFQTVGKFKRTSTGDGAIGKQIVGFSIRKPSIADGLEIGFIDVTVDPTPISGTTNVFEYSFVLDGSSNPIRGIDSDDLDIPPQKYQVENQYDHAGDSIVGLIVSTQWAAELEDLFTANTGLDSGVLGEDIAQNKAVAVDTTDGLIYKFDSGNSNHNLIGILESAGIATDTRNYYTFNGQALNFVGLTAGAIQFASETVPGDIVEIQTSFALGTANPDGTIINMSNASLLGLSEENVKDNTSIVFGSVSGERLAQAKQEGRSTYAKDIGTTDAYEVGLTPSISEYTDGMPLSFKANTINSGSATVNFNSVGVLVMKKGANKDLESGDIEAGQIVFGIVDAESTDSITAFANGGGGKVDVTSVGHGLNTGDVVEITGTTNYNGTFTVIRQTADIFEITDTWVSDDATGTWTKEGIFQIQTPSSALPSANDILTTDSNINNIETGSRVSAFNGSGGSGVITNFSEDVDKLNNLISGIFTAPEAGDYLVSFGCQTVESSFSTQLFLFKNTSTLIQQLAHVEDNNSNRVVMSNTRILVLAINDTLHLQVGGGSCTECTFVIQRLS